MWILRNLGFVRESILFIEDSIGLFFLLFRSLYVRGEIIGGLRWFGKVGCW